VNYRVKFDSGQIKTFHITMLKKYYERENEEQSVQNKGQETNGESEGERMEKEEDENEEIAAAMGIVK